jgi:lipid-binding SYLF domain-containing protein
MSSWQILVSILLSVNFLGACTHEQPAASAPAPGAEDEQRIVDRSAEAIRRLRGSPEFSALDGYLKDARGVLVFPELVKASFILGGEGGNGVLVARGADGSFSAPAFYSIGAGSVGVQVGYREAAVVLLLMKETALSAVLRSGLTLGADATVAAGTNTGEARSATATKDVIAFVDADGVFAGASVEGAVVEPRPKLNHAYYGADAATADIVVNRRYDHPGARTLRDALAPRAGAAAVPVASATTNGAAGARLAPPPGEQRECSPESRQVSACTFISAPVCGIVDTGIRCIKAPCPEAAKFSDFPNACLACKEQKTIGYYSGACVGQNAP